MSAPTFALAALGNDILGSVRVGDKLLVTAECEVEHNSPCEGLALSEVAQRYRVIVVTHRSRSGPIEVAPPPRTPLRAGDRLAIQGSIDAIAEARAAMRDEALHRLRTDH